MRLAVTLACLLMAPAALAAETITLPSPWSSEKWLSYSITTDGRSDGPDPIHLVEREVIEVRMVTNERGERVQRWTTLDSSANITAAPAGFRRLYEHMEALQPPPTDIRLDAKGGYAGIENLDALAAWRADAATPGLKAMIVETHLEGNAPEDREKATLLAEGMLPKVVELFASPRSMEIEMLWRPTLFNAWSGRTWEVGREYLVIRDIPVIDLNENIPGTWTYHFTLLDDGKARVEWNVRADRGATRLVESGHARIDRASGMIDRLEFKRTETSSGTTNTTRQTWMLESAVMP